MYKASDELVEIFKKNGFSDITDRNYPQHASRIVMVKYDPGKHKREFQVGNYSKATVLFDYISIIPYVRAGSCESRLSMTEQELQSLITFYKLSPLARNRYRETGGKIFEVYSMYQRICKGSPFYNRKEDRELKAVYESVVF